MITTRDRQFIDSSSNTPWFPVVDTCWQLFNNMDYGAVQAYLAVRWQQGFNCIRVFGTDELAFSTSGKAYSKYWDFVGKCMALFPNVGMRVWFGVGPIAHTRAVDANEYAKGYLRWPRGTFKSNAYWVAKFMQQFGDSVFAYSCVSVDTGKGAVSYDDMDEVAKGLRSGDAGRLIGHHPKAGTAAITKYTTIAEAQSGSNTNPDFLRYMYQVCKPAGLPFFNGEAKYEGFKYGGGVGTAENIKTIVNTDLDKVAGLSYGARKVIWLMPGWDAWMYLPGIRHVMEAAAVRRASAVVGSVTNGGTV